MSKRHEFNTMGAARGFAGRAVKPLALILGDNGLIWAVTLAEAERLTKAGYEFAE
jgi:hypothetical protein